MTQLDLFKASHDALVAINTLYRGATPIEGLVQSEEFRDFDACVDVIGVFFKLFIRTANSSWTPHSGKFADTSKRAKIYDHFSMLEKSNFIGTFRDDEAPTYAHSRAALVGKIAIGLKVLLKQKGRNYEVWKKAMDHQAKKSTGITSYACLLSKFV